MQKNPFSWLTLSILFSLGWALIYFDRMMFTPILSTLANDYQLNSSALGNVFSLFFLGYTLLQIPGGILGEKLGSNKVIYITFLGLAIISLLNAGLESFVLFLVLRFLAGAFEGLYYGPLFALTSKTIPLKHKVFATTLINSGMSLGIVLGTTLPLAIVGQGLSYRWLYIVVVIGALLLAYLLTRTMPSVPHVQTPIRFHLNRPLLIIFFVSFCSLYAFFNLLTWLQLYLLDEKALSAGWVATAMSLISVVSFASSLLFARIVDRYKVNKPMMLVLLACAAIALLAITLTRAPVILFAAIIAYGVFGKMALDPLLIIAVAKANACPSLSTTLSIFNCVGLLSSVIAPSVGGYIQMVTGSLAGSFYLSALLLVVSFFLLLTFYKDNTTESITP